MTISERQRLTGSTEPQPPGNRLLSDEAMLYVDQLPARQAAATQDPTLNGQDAERRLRGE